MVNCVKIVGIPLTLALAALLYPIANLFALPASYLQHRSPHPTSPHTPPRHPLTSIEIDTYRRDGVLVLQNILDEKLAQNMRVAGLDLINENVLHCECAKFVGPPIFHGYHRFCSQALLVHDYFRDVVYQSRLAHVAAQLVNASEDETLRHFGDVFMAGDRLPKRWHTDFLAFAPHSYSRSVPCMEGLVMWLPLQKTSLEANGMLLVNGSHNTFQRHFQKVGSEAAYHVKNHFKFYAETPKEAAISPTVDLGDAIIFSQCTVHATSGIHHGGMRMAYQLRFAKNANPVLDLSSSPFPGIPLHPEAHVEAPQIWPQTLPAEDAVRAKGHSVWPVGAWLQKLATKPMFAFATLTFALKVKVCGDAGES